MRKISCALLLALAPSFCLAGSYFSPANVSTACTIAAAAEQTVLADETLANQIAGKQVVRTGTTATIANLTPTLCAQIGGVVGSISNSVLAGAPVVPSH